jgi:hypothetical protein
MWVFFGQKNTRIAAFSPQISHGKLMPTRATAQSLFNLTVL